MVTDVYSGSTFFEFRLGLLIKEDEMGGVCSTNGAKRVRIGHC
jgi:hypothetical protein